MPIFAGAVAGARSIFMGRTLSRGMAPSQAINDRSYELNRFGYDKPNFTPLGRAVGAYAAYKGAETAQKEGGRKQRKHLQ